MGNWRRGLAASATTVLLLAGVAGAANPTAFSDPIGDAGAWLDIASLNISEDDGDLFFQVNFAGKVDWDEDGPRIALDLDQNPDTGSAFYGTEVMVAFEGEGHAREGRAVLYHSDGWDFRGATPPEGWGWGLGPHEVDFFLSRAQLGIGASSGFNVVAATIASQPDTAPDMGTFNYQPVAGTPPPSLGRDRRAPHVVVYPSTAIRGRIAKLTYWVLDGRGRTAEVIRIYRARRLLKTIRIPLHNANPFDLSHAKWRVPRALHGRLRFSVRATDAGGNRSRLISSSLTVR